ncbi:hypothetical protein [Actinospica robiniae]|uniref:hypothetical protein n=1 Tax=Actinospica robiniae TaxID=304901 RepID=UPI00041E8FB5|nr:hypothetical protein [Actinospica robiniae]
MTTLETAPRTYPAGVGSGPQLRAALAELTEDALAALFDRCARPLVYSRHHWLRYKGEYRVRADLRGAMEELRTRPPSAWDDEESDLVLTLLALDRAQIGLDDLLDRADSAAVRDALLTRAARYAEALGDGAAEPPEAVLDLAGYVDLLRPRVQESFELFSLVDGKAWYATEGLFRREEIDLDHLTPSMEHVLDALYGEAPGGADARSRLIEATRAAVAADGDGAQIVRAVMHAALLDPVLRPDHVTLTCPLGDLLDRPHEMTTSAAFFTETLLREDLDLADHAEQLGHDSVEQLHRTIRARMLKLKRGAIRSLYGPGCMHGRFVEKHGGHMIFFNEDAHYRGHQSIGCSSGGRAAFALRYPGADGAELALTPMIGDFRVVRMSHDAQDVFAPGELPRAIRYGRWLCTVVEEIYRLGAVLRTPVPEDADL